MKEDLLQKNILNQDKHDNDLTEEDDVGQEEDSGDEEVDNKPTEEGEDEQ